MAFSSPKKDNPDPTGTIDLIKRFIEGRCEIINLGNGKPHGGYRYIYNPFTEIIDSMR